MTFSPPQPTSAPADAPTLGGVPGDPRCPALSASVVSPSRWRRVVGPLAFAGTMSAAALALHLRDPHSDGAWGKCPTLCVTGLACPFCGGLRAVNDLTNGDVGAAFSSNAAFVIALPLLALWWALVVKDRWEGRHRAWTWPLEKPGVLPGVLAVLAVFTLVRNLPVGAVLHP